MQEAALSAGPPAGARAGPGDELPLFSRFSDSSAISSSTLVESASTQNALESAYPASTPSPKIADSALSPPSAYPDDVADPAHGKPIGSANPFDWAFADSDNRSIGTGSNSTLMPAKAQNGDLTPLTAQSPNGILTGDVTSKTLEDLMYTEE